MNVTAEELDRLLTTGYAEREKAVSQIEKRILDVWEEVRPTVKVLKKHGEAFYNSYLDAETKQGILVGAEGSSFIVLEGDRVFYVDRRNDSPAAEKVMTLKAYIVVANLEILKEGIDFVRNAYDTVYCALEKKTRALNNFLNAC